MHPDFRFSDRLFGGGTNGVFGDAVLCISLFHFCGADDYFVGIFIIIVVDCAGGSERAGTLSDEGFADSIGIDDRAENKIYFAISGVVDYAGDCLGDRDVAVDFV